MISITNVLGGFYLGNEVFQNFIRNCTFLNNTSLNGAAIYLSSPGNLEISDCIFSFNQAFAGSSIYFLQNGSIKILSEKSKINEFYHRRIDQLYLVNNIKFFFLKWGY